MRWIVTIVVWLTAAEACWSEPRQMYPPYTKPTLIAHRGASWDAPEHTLAAYKLALKHQADFVEPDLQMTKDGVLICLHDVTLERTTNVEEVFPDRVQLVGDKQTWPVVDFTLSEIKQLDAGSWKSPQFAGATIPTLDEMIGCVKGRAGIIPETKSPELYGGHGLSMERALVELLAKHRLDQPGLDPATPVVIQSFSAESLKVLRNDLGCKLPLVFLTTRAPATATGLKRVREFADGVAPNKADVLARPELVAEAHALGMSVTCWTFRSGQTGSFANVRDEMRHFLHDLKVDALFTDNPDQFPRD